MKYHLSLPEGWTAGRPWPVVVLVPDASREFEANLAAFVKARGALPYILVAPHVVTSGGANYRLADTYRYSEADWKRVAADGDFRFDDEGIAAVLADVRRDFGGEERVFLTGWEAGGHTVWAYTFRHPERLRASAPVSTNYLGRWLDEAAFSRDSSRATLPVKVLFCERSVRAEGMGLLHGAVEERACGGRGARLRARHARGGPGQAARAARGRRPCVLRSRSKRPGPLR